METWLDIARSNQRAAASLFDEGHYRSAVSRAYYTVYARVTHALVLQGVAMPEGQEGPRHQKLVPLIGDNLRKPAFVGRLVRRLYLMRCHADYIPSVTVGARDGRNALSLMYKALEML
jgi:uncharacterized protein (UPF0332 family)